MKTSPLVVVVIEHSDELRDMYARALRLEAFAVEEARDGQEGITKAAALLPQLIITAISMPVMNRATCEVNRAVVVQPQFHSRWATRWKARTWTPG